MGLVKEVPVNKVYLGIGAKEPLGVIAAAQSSVLIDNTSFYFFLVDGQVVSS